MRSRRPRKLWLPGLMAIPAVIVALTGCGSSGGGAGTGTNSNPAQAAANSRSFLRFSQCMRTHGVSNFPDPGPGGGLRIQLGSGLNPASPAFQSAQKTCFKLLPGGGPSRHPVSAAERLALLHFSECMRAHGVPDFADPQFPKGGGIVQTAPSGAAGSAPAFQRAQKACGQSGP